MAKSKNGFFGQLSGRIGNVVVSSWKGIPYIRSKPVGNTSNTRAQQNQRGKFKLVIDFLNSIKPVINAGFKWNTDRMTEMNSATSYIMKRAVRGEHPDLRIHYPLVLVARGDLPEPQQTAVTRENETELRFSWRCDTNSGRGRGKDHVLALAYCPETERGVWLADGSVLRKEQQFKLTLPQEWNSRAVETYLAFAAPDGSDASNSVHLGRL